MTDDLQPRREPLDQLSAKELLKRAKTLFNHVDGCTCKECIEYVEHWVQLWLVRND